MVPDFRQRVAAIWREVLRDAERREKFRIVRENFGGRVAAVKVAEQAGHGFDDLRIRIAMEMTFPGAEFRDEPKSGQTAGNQICLYTVFWREARTRPGFFNEKRQPVLSVFQGGQLPGEFNLFFREVHGAEAVSIRLAGRLFGRRRNRRFLVVLDGLTVARFIPARRPARRRQLAPRRLDAAERAAEFVNFALIGELLAFGDFDEFEHFVKLVDHLLERLGDFRGVGDGLADGGSFRRTKIGRLDPRLRTQRFRAALGPLFTLKFTLRLAGRWGGADRFRRRRSFFCGRNLVSSR